MTANFENEILFDDAAALEDKLGESCLSITAVTGDCDCSGYTSIQGDDDTNTSEESGTAS